MMTEEPPAKSETETPAEGADRRRSDRLPLHIWVEEKSSNASYFHQAANLSLGGIYLRKSLPYEIGTQLEIRFTLPGDPQAIVTSAEVVRYIWDDDAIEQMGMGLRFLTLSEADRNRIATMLRAS